eukprot:gene12377-12511_t
MQRSNRGPGRTRFPANFFESDEFYIYHYKITPCDK